MHLLSKVTSPIRFSEVDPLGIVWHGNYVKYFEDGREAFGREFDLNYLDLFQAGLVTPIVKLDVSYKKEIKYGDKALIETQYVDSPAAKIQFKYRIYRSSDEALVTTGSTTQVFLNAERQLLLAIPPMFEQWKKRWKLI